MEYSLGSNGVLCPISGESQAVELLLRTHGKGEIIVDMAMAGYLTHSERLMTDAVPLTPRSFRRQLSRLDCKLEDGERQRRAPVSNWLLFRIRPI